MCNGSKGGLNVIYRHKIRDEQIVWKSPILITWYELLWLSLSCGGWQLLFYGILTKFSWWRHQIETFSALLALCAGNSPVPGEFPTQRPVTRSFDVFFHLRLNKQLSKQSWGWWFDTLSHPLWRHCDVISCHAKSLPWIRQSNRSVPQSYNAFVPYPPMLHFVTEMCNLIR